MGRTYVCSDIHSHLDVLEMALADMQDDDKLYIIGDAVDKGPDGVKILLKAMEDKRIELIMGNHDLMMLEFLACQDSIHAKKSGEYNEIFDIWIDLNGGMETIEHFFSLSKQEQKKIRRYLEKRPVTKHIEVNGRKFILVHASMGGADVKNDIYVSHLKREYGLYDWRSKFVWDRQYREHVNGHILITGHTPTRNYQFDSTDAITDGEWYDIDCCLAYRKKGSKLGVLCLDDLSVRYYYPKTL